MFSFRRLTSAPLVLSLLLGTVCGTALEVARPSIVFAQSNPSREADRLLDEGLELYRISQWPQALDNWQRALALYRQVGNRFGEADVLNNIGLIYKSLGDYPEALDSYDQSLAFFRALGDRVGEFKTLANIGVIYQLLGDYPQALDYQEQSLAITRELDDRVGEASSLCKITLTSAPDSQSTSAGDSH